MILELGNKLQGQVTCLLKLAANPDSDIQIPLVVTASADATLKVWDPMKIKEPGMHKEATCVQVCTMLTLEFSNCPNWCNILYCTPLNEDIISKRFPNAY